jgi:Pyruvate kinase, barrel domain
MMFRSAARRLASMPPSLRSFQSASIKAPLTTKFNLPDPASPDEYSAMTKKFAPKLTKIVATIGPKSEQLPVLQEVVKNGMRIMRLNFSHATTDEVELRMGNLQQCRVSE